jgi:hypothetical protein
MNSPFANPQLGFRAGERGPAPSRLYHLHGILIRAGAPVTPQRTARQLAAKTFRRVDAIPGRYKSVIPRL